MSVYGSEGEPRTIVIPIDSTQTARYMLPPGIAQYVQSVLVNVDASGGPAVRPTLRILEQSGVVIAAKRQGEAIPAGDTGTATWALRLTDEGTGGSGGTGIEFDKDNEGGYLDVTVNDVDPEGYGFKLVSNVDGDVLLGFPVDGSQGGRSGNVLFGVGYSGDRQFIFLADDDSGGVTTSLIIDSTALILSGDRMLNAKVITDSMNQYIADFGGTSMTFVLRPGSKYIFRNDAFAKIFQIDEDGSLHGVTGKSLTFDL